MFKAPVQRIASQIWKTFRDSRHSLLSQGSPKLSSTNVSVAFEHLTSRSIVRVSGENASEFLQGLVTNDMQHLQEDANSSKEFSTKAMYCMFLDARGRVILDSIIYKMGIDSKSGNKEAVFLVECDTEIESTLVKHLKMYKLRKKVDIAKISDEMDVWVEFTPNARTKCSGAVENCHVVKRFPNELVCKDPRLSCLGVRHLCPKSECPVCDGKDKKILDSDHYTALRYSLGVGEGIQDHPPGVCFPLESNGDYLHGISFHKGCYVGQELTARTHHTGVVRKRLMPLIFPNDTKLCIPIQTDTSIIDGTTGKTVGKVRGITNCGGNVVGLGLLRVVEVLKSASLKVCDSEAKTLRPFWWPEEAPRDVKSAAKA